MTLSTDVIVGFPGETDADFEADARRSCATSGFVGLFGFKYSPRPFTPALKLADDVPEEAKAERLARLFEVAESQTRAHLATLVGTRQRVLVEGASKAQGKVTGRTERNEIVHLDVPEGRDLVGRARRRRDHAGVQALAARHARRRRHRGAARRGPRARRSAPSAAAAR